MAKTKIIHGCISDLEVDGIRADQWRGERLSATHHFDFRIDNQKVEFCSPRDVNFHENDEVTIVGSQSSDGILYAGAYENYSTGTMHEDDAAGYFILALILVLFSAITYHWIVTPILILPFAFWLLLSGFKRTLFSRLLSSLRDN